jgi:hypothetical protein
MQLWIYWWNAIWLLRPGCTRLRTFLWFATCVAGLTVRTDLLGVTSIVRALGLHERFYDRLLDNFHSTGMRLDKMSTLWAQVVLRLFPDPLRVNGRLVLVGDGIKVPKSGKKMPALLRTVEIRQPVYFVADAYYASQKIITGLLDQDNHLITRVRSNAVAYTLYHHQGAKKRGRPRVYGKKIALKSLFNDGQVMEQAASPVYGEKNVTLQYRVCDLLWRPVGRLVRFVVVIYPTRGRCLLMSTDTSLSAIEIIRLYGLRFKIEHGFKQAVRVIGAFSYHFWMKKMKPLRRRNGNQYLHRESSAYRDAVKRKINAYHVFIHAGLVSQGLLQYLAANVPKLVWASFGSWLRTIRPGIAPSELVVATALRHSLPEFLLNTAQHNIFAKFIVHRQDPDRLEVFRIASG